MACIVRCIINEKYIIFYPINNILKENKFIIVMIFFIKNSMINEERIIVDLKKEVIPNGKFILYV